MRVFLTLRSWGRLRPRTGGGLYRRSGLTCAEIHSAVSRDLASVWTLVMCERDVSSAYPSGNSSTGSSPWSPSLRIYPSATSLPATPLCPESHRMVTSLFLVRAQADLDGRHRESLAGAKGVEGLRGREENMQCVCNRILSCCMQAEGPWQQLRRRRWLFLENRFCDYSPA